ncbi:hypothetical protein GUJ93_ZPchr0005g15297 [Zizania palustris]|uniref:Uncharacterized protein n=1 Tax=Zizania palustris TaxID=103762 RepID=A0A8J5STW8_ZIZPA|nr:hypothetical protein GUJ93_ZPchr0005g15297 [Zizania palustris]
MKVLGALVKQKGITNHSYNPNLYYIKARTSSRFRPQPLPMRPACMQPTRAALLRATASSRHGQDCNCSPSRDLSTALALSLPPSPSVVSIPRTTHDNRLLPHQALLLLSPASLPPHATAPPLPPSLRPSPPPPHSGPPPSGPSFACVRPLSPLTHVVPAHVRLLRSLTRAAPAHNRLPDAPHSCSHVTSIITVLPSFDLCRPSTPLCLYCTCLPSVAAGTPASPFRRWNNTVTILLIWSDKGEEPKIASCNVLISVIRHVL